MATSPLEEDENARPSYQLNPAGSSRPPSSAGSTIDDPDMTDDEAKAYNDSEDARSRNHDTASPGPPTSNTGSPRPTMDRLIFKSHNFTTPPKHDTEKSGRPGSAKRARKSKSNSSRGTYSWVQEGNSWVQEGQTKGDNGNDEDEEVKVEKSGRRESDPESKHVITAGSATVVGTRRQANGTIGSVYSGNKIRHLKKDDGVPLWRKDIQYEFLRRVFDDEHPVFTRTSDGQPNCFFADIYIDAMARSSKTSKILKDKLQLDRAAAKNMAMICLLVNVGRMNTTLNFFPEMRAQLRTYHSIPSLQARADASAYKQLQDAPRLKSILKGASEDTEEPRTVESIKAHAIPRTNPVNLIFVLSQYAPKISELHFFPPQDFFDLVMRHTISSKSRANAFLWLMWWYLESDFSKEAALRNPFGPGILGDDAKEGDMPLKVPVFEHLTEEQGDLENVDTPDEVKFGEEKQGERKKILEEDETTQDKTIKRLKKTAEGSTEYDSSPGLKPTKLDDISRIPPQRLTEILDPATSRLGGQADSLDDEWEPVNPHPGRGRYKRPTKKDREAREEAQRPALGSRTSLSGRPLHRTAKAQIQVDRDTPSEAAVTPQPPGSSAHPVLQSGPDASSTVVPTVTGPGGRRPRPLTAHQLAVEAHRRSRVEWILALKKQAYFAELETKREAQPWLERAIKRIENLPAGYDSEDEENSWGMGGLGANPDDEEEDDYGEEAEMWLRVLRRAKRRLERWEGGGVETGGRRERMRERARKERSASEREMEMEKEGSEVPELPPTRREGTRRKPAGSSKRRSAAGGASKSSRRPRGARVLNEWVLNGDASSVLGADSEDLEGDREDEGDGDIDDGGDGEDVTMLLEEELGGSKAHHGGEENDEDEGLDDIDKDLLAEVSDDEVVGDDGEGSDGGSGMGSDGDVEMD